MISAESKRDTVRFPEEFEEAILGVEARAGADETDASRHGRKLSMRGKKKGGRNEGKKEEKKRKKK